MKIVFERNELVNIINTIQKAVSAKSVMPILECIKIEALTNGDVIISSASFNFSFFAVSYN